MPDFTHTQGDLEQMMSLPLEAKVRMSQNRIRAWYEHWDGQVYVSFSGGKDSTVLKHVVESIYPDVPSVFVNTGLEYPEVRSFALHQPNVVRVDPKMKFYEVVETYGYPVVSKEQAQYIWEARNTKSEKLRHLRLNGRPENKQSGRISTRWQPLLRAPFKISHKCCEVMKKAPARKYERETGRRPIVGTMALESRLRYSIWLRHGCNAFEGRRPMSAPLSFWTEQDILHYLADNYLDYAKCYGSMEKDADGTLHLTGLQRTGCMFCMFGVQREATPNRFQRMALTHPKQYEYCMNKLGLKDVLEYMNIEYKPKEKKE